MGSIVFFTDTKWPGCEVHCLLPVTSQVKKICHCTTLFPQRFFMAWSGTNSNFIILFIFSVYTVQLGMVANSD